MILPSDATVSVQRALGDLDKRLRTLEKSAGPTDTTELERSITDLRSAMVRKPNFLDEQDVFVGSGTGHSHGLVPNPGPYGGRSAAGVERVLHEDGKWKPPLEGLIRPIPSGAGGTSTAQRTLNVLGSLSVVSSLSADATVLRSVAGLDSVHGVQLVGRAYSGTPSATVNGNSGSAETNVTAYNWTLKENTLGFDGDSLEFVITTFLNGTEAGTKTLKLYIAGVNTTVYTTTSTTNALIIQSRLAVTRRSSTTAALTGFTWFATAASTSPVWYMANTSYSAINWASNQLIQITLQNSGGSSNILVAADYSARLFSGHAGVGT